jgi:GAF domain-containing protein
MPFYPLPAQETERLEKLRSYEILDSLPEEAHDRITRLAARMLDMPVAVISLVEGDRQWFKAQVGGTRNEIPRELSFCAHAICQDDVFVIEDTTKDPRFSQNPFVTGDPNVRFYAGAPLRTNDGLNMGTLAVLDSKPRTLSEDDKQNLTDLRRWSWTRWKRVSLLIVRTRRNAASSTRWSPCPTGSSCMTRTTGW